MRRALIGAVAVLLLLAAAPARAVTIDGPWWAQRAVNAARVPVVPDQTVILAPCPGYAGVAGCNFVTPDSPIYMDVPAPFDTVAGLRMVLYRELGGRFETVAMYPWAVEHFQKIVRRHAGPEVFEDAYADCALGLMPRRETLQHPDNRWIDAAGYDPSRRQHARVCRLIRRVGILARLTEGRPAPAESIPPGSASRP